MPRKSDPVYKHAWYMSHRALCFRRSKAYGYTVFGKLCRMYSSAKQRVLGQDRDRAHKYAGLPICTRQEFYTRFLNDPVYLAKFSAWKASGFPLRMSPSLDRINNKGGYTLDNVQILTQSENRRKEVH